jgi:hypothetical protein
LVGLVDDADAVGVEQLGAAEEVVDGQRDFHGTSLRAGARSAAKDGCVRRGGRARAAAAR